MSNDTYVDLVLRGEALADDLDDWIDRWHESPNTEPLHAYLGMSWDEFRLWTEQPRSLRFILAARRTRQPVPQSVGELVLAAARAADDSDAAAVHAWLEKTGRVPSR